jgi:hypothetical protein
MGCMISPSPLSSPDLTAEALDPTRLARHQIRDDLQAIHIGLHLLERRLDMSEYDVQAELIDLRASLRKTVRVMDTLVRLRQNRPSAAE